MLKKLLFLSWLGKNDILYKNLRNEVVMLVKQAETYNYQNILRNSKGNSKKLWKCMQNITPNHQTVLNRTQVKSC